MLGYPLRRCCLGFCCSRQSSTFGRLLSSCLNSKVAVAALLFSWQYVHLLYLKFCVGGGILSNSVWFASVPSRLSVLLSTKTNSISDGAWLALLCFWRETLSCGPVALHWPEGGQLCWKERSSYAVTCLWYLSFFLGPFRHNSSCLEYVTSSLNARKWLVASHGGAVCQDEDPGLDTGTTVMEGTELLPHPTAASMGCCVHSFLKRACSVKGVC